MLLPATVIVVMIGCGRVIGAYRADAVACDNVERLQAGSAAS
jgi:hypothetical protein